VHKIAGHMAEGGASLSEIAKAASDAASDIRSLGVALSSCAIPGQPFEARMGEEEAELGLGIHGEPGIERIALREIDAIVSLMADRLAGTLTAGEADHALIVNNLGAVPPIEMGVIVHDVLRSALAPRIGLLLGPGPYMTALNMNGFSLSLMRLDAGRRAALASPVEPVAWTGLRAPGPVTLVPLDGRKLSDAPTASAGPALEALLHTACMRLVTCEAELNRLDARTGDGDTGSTMATGARSVLAALPRLPLGQPGPALRRIGEILSASMGGTSGVLLSIFFTSAGQKLGEGADVAAALAEGLARIRFYGGAGPGDRTLIDALAPAIDALAAGDLAAAATAAGRGAEATAAMTRARAGRASYLAEADLAGVPDPGAVAVAEVFAALAGARR
jgi:triose/dihydroxyacetone kinase / FAD-AMP lyase (cyclizing)